MTATIKREHFPPQFREERKNLSELERKILIYRFTHSRASYDEIAYRLNTTPTHVQEIINRCAKYYGMTP